jgi:4-amino-4-deoxy-L-arabinose transferase-like glycosyltransferase
MIDTRRRNIAWGLWTLALTMFYVSVVTPNLDNFRPVSSDDAWIMSIAYKLATQGILGSDMYAGFFHANQRWLINPPLHFILQAIVFRLDGAGVAQARWVSVTSAMVLIAVVGWVALNWYGLAVSILTGALLVFWRCDLIASYTDLPLLAVTRTARSDLDVVAGVWLAIFWLNQLLQHPRRSTALALGLSSGAATLTQFLGAFVVPLCAVAWIGAWSKRALTDAISYTMVAGFLVVILPFALYLMPEPADLIGQARYLAAGRLEFNRIGFYLDNLGHEPERFAALVQKPLPSLRANGLEEQPLSPWLLVAGIVPALVWLIRRIVRRHARGDILLGLSLVSFEGLLALLDQTKAALYALILLPSLCLLFAAFSVSLVHWVKSGDAALGFRVSLGAMLVVLGLVVTAESLRAYQMDRQLVSSVSPYGQVGQRIESYLEPAATIFGTERWWWALREQRYLSLTTLWVQWMIAAQAAGPPPRFGPLMKDSALNYVIVNNNVRGDIRGYPDRLQEAFWNFLDRCGSLTVRWTDASYGEIEIYRIAGAASDDNACR